MLESDLVPTTTPDLNERMRRFKAGVCERCAAPNPGDRYCAACKLFLEGALHAEREMRQAFNDGLKAAEERLLQQARADRLSAGKVRPTIEVQATEAAPADSRMLEA